jgi:hypothetical protein
MGAAPGCEVANGRDPAFDRALEALFAGALPEATGDTFDLWVELAAIDRAIARVAVAVEVGG